MVHTLISEKENKDKDESFWCKDHYSLFYLHYSINCILYPDLGVEGDEGGASENMNFVVTSC